MKGRILSLAVVLAVFVPGTSSAGSRSRSQSSRAPIVVRVSDGGFHWGDAAIGAAATAGVALALHGTSLVRRQLKKEER